MRGTRLRHRIAIDRKDVSQDPATGAITESWARLHDDVPADFLSGPGREYLAADAIRAEVDGRFRIRYLPGLDATMRVLWDGQIWSIVAPPILDKTARREMTLMVKAGANDG